MFGKFGILLLISVCSQAMTDPLGVAPRLLNGKDIEPFADTSSTSTHVTAQTSEAATSTKNPDKQITTDSDTITITASTSTNESSSTSKPFPTLSRSTSSSQNAKSTGTSTKATASSTATDSTSSSSDTSSSDATSSSEDSSSTITQTTLPDTSTPTTVSASISSTKTMIPPMTTNLAAPTLPVSTTIVQSTITNTATSAPASSTSAAAPVKGCQPGSDCAWHIAVGVSSGCVFLFAALFIFCCKYRKSLIHSRESYLAGRWRHKYDEDKPYGHGTIDKNQNSVGLTQLPSHSPPPEYARKDELFLPQDVQQVVDRVNDMRNQNVRVPANTYGSVVRKPCPNYRDF